MTIQSQVTCLAHKAHGQVCGGIVGRRGDIGSWLYPLTGLLNWLVAAIVFGKPFRFNAEEFLFGTLLAVI